ncbi:hypothetical protein [Halorubrum sp. Atlit-26R]|uniref:hypothetical protein n=1 Tax=Halorubrum sp. Atlit-26R TaxID=2282128 RepID=UPI000EF1B869|nr:hypothetical protein [Halorubrum sp. Atlit-26R]RLM67179.1 hypothetical protein DVK07_13465 [Halorubrum sp. Atlit-26R]
MSRTGAWSFATVGGRVRVAPDEIRIRRGVVDALRGVPRALAAGRVPPELRDVGWSGVGAVLALGSLVPNLLWDDVGAIGAGDLLVAGVGLLAAVGGVAVTIARRRRVAIRLDAVDYVAFEEEELVVVYDGNGEGDDTRETLRPRDDDERADAAVALRLRGVELRGVDGDERVSRTVVDAPETELVG